MIERKLAARDRIPENIAVNNNMTGMDDKMVRVKNLPCGVDDKMVRVKSLPYGMDDKMVRVKNLPYGMDDQMVLEKYYDVYIEDGNSPVNNGIEKRLQILVQIVQHGLANVSAPPHRYVR